MHPKLLTAGQFADLLQEVRIEVERSGTMEGSLRYSSPKPGVFAVHAAIRTGNEMGQGGVLLIEGLPIYVEGYTKAGHYVRIEGDPYGRDREKARIFVDDQFIDGRDCEMGRARDGGSTNIKLPDGRVIFKPADLLGERYGGKPVFPSLGSETIEPVEPL